MMIDSLIPQNHLVSRLDDILDFSFIADITWDYGGESSDISPEFIARYLLLIYLYDLERKTPALLDMQSRIDQQFASNMAYRWFVKVDIGEDMPKFDDVINIAEKLGGRGIWDAIIKRLLRTCAENGLPNKQGGALYID